MLKVTIVFSVLLLCFGISLAVTTDYGTEIQLIDDFSYASTVDFQPGVGSTPTAYAESDTSGTIFTGQRDVAISVDSETGDNIYSSHIASNLWAAGYSNYDCVAKLALQYDGPDYSGVLNLGYGPYDLTVSGAADSFKLSQVTQVNLASGASPLTITVYTLTNACSYQFTATDTVDDYIIPFTSFSSGCTFSNAQAITLEVPYTGSVTFAMKRFAIHKICTPLAKCKDISVEVNTAITVAMVDNGSEFCTLTPSLSVTQIPCTYASSPVSDTLTVGPSSCTSMITPYADIDVGTCPGNINVPSDSCTGSFIDYTKPNDVTADCPNSGKFSPVSGSFFTAGSTTIVTYTVKDTTLAQTSDSCTFTVKVGGVAGTGVPKLGTHDEVFVASSTPLCTMRVNWIPPIIEQICTNYTVAATKDPDTFFTVPSNTTITYTLTGIDGQSTQTSFNVRVDDGYPPILTCPADETHDNSLGYCAYNEYTAIDPTYVDCDVVTFSHVVPTGPVAVGDHNDTITGTDSFGNQAQCWHDVKVRDVEAPTFTACPSTVVKIYADGTGCTVGTACTTVIDYTVTATDNCPPAVTPVSTSGLEDGSSQQLGSYSITSVATDQYSNKASCSFNLEVIGCQIVTASQSVSFSQTITFTYNYYLPTDTQVYYRILNSSNRAIKIGILNVSGGTGTFTYAFSNTAAPGSYTVALRGVTSAIDSILNPTITVT